MSKMDDYLKQTLESIESKIIDHSILPLSNEDLITYTLLKIHDKLQSIDGTLVLILSKMKDEE